MKPLFDAADQPRMHQSINMVIQELCALHNSADMEQDIVALFEDILKFFAGREEEFKHLDDLSNSEKEVLYTEINIIIELFKKLKMNMDRDIAISILSEKLIKAFCKNPARYAFLSKSQILSELEQERIKEDLGKNITNILLQKQRDVQHRIRFENMKSIKSERRRGTDL